MPYNKLSALPDYILKYSKKIQRIFMKTFNAAYAAFDSKKHKAKSAEEYAFKVANAAVKKAKNKSNESIGSFPKGTKFATENEVSKYMEIIETILNESGDDMNNEMPIREFQVGDRLPFSLKEAQINKESRTATIVALEKGWSTNGNYYSKEVAESLSKHMLKRRKIYLNHVGEAEKKLGRDLRDWVATVETAHGSEGQTIAKIAFTETDVGTFIFKEALKRPEEIQFSIDAYCTAHTGEVEGREGNIIGKFVFLESLDCVDYAAAGGKLIQAYASKRMRELNIITEVSNRIRKRINRDVEIEKLRGILKAFENMLYSLSWMFEDEEEESDVKETFDSVVDAFVEKLKTEVDLSVFTESNKPKKEGELIMEITLEMLKKEHPEILEAFKSELSIESKIDSKDSEIDSLKESVKTTEASVSSLETEVTSLKGSVKTKETEMASVSEELNKYKLAELIAKKKDMVSRLVKESKLGEFDNLPEYTQNDLLSKEKEEDVKSAISALESFISNASGIISGAGEGREGEESEHKALSDEDAANLLKW